MDSSKIRGLSEAEAEQRFRMFGPNELPRAERPSFFRLLIQILREPTVALIFACGVIYFFLGDLQDTVVLMAFLVLILIITLIQEWKAERALEALRDLSSPRALVLRGGKQVRIPGREVVHDDILILDEGDRVPADAILLFSTHLEIDESILTGESIPVFKSAETSGKKNIVFAATTVVRGHGLARVCAVGSATELGKIGKLLHSVGSEPTQLQRELAKTVRVIARWAIFLCIVVSFVYWRTRGNFLSGLLTGLTLAIAILPNEIPAVLLIFLALGAWRLARNHVLTRRMPAIETLGSTTVLCVDKTGTLTLNQMRVRRMHCRGEMIQLTDPHAVLRPSFQDLLDFAILASKPNPVDSMEKALRELDSQALSNKRFIREYPLSPEIMALSQVWEQKEPAAPGFVIAAKGAPESIAILAKLSEPEIRSIQDTVEAMADEGLRVIAVAKGALRGGALPADQKDFEFEFLGLIGLEDPVRPGVPDAVSECLSAGIRVVMITGDHPRTARTVAGRIGIPSTESSGAVVTGRELEEMSDEEVEACVRRANVFARIVPSQKLLLVNALKAHGEVVAMTGDGINDAPALKSAHIGVAMGSRGTDVAREASSIVLLDDDFTSIVRSIRSGRTIFDNLKHALAYLLAVHIPIAGISVLPVLFKLPLVLLPMHIAFLHLIIEPACSIVFEAEPSDHAVMTRPPRDPRSPLFSGDLLAPALFQGLSVLFILTLVFLISLWRGQGEAEARALTFTTLIVANLALIVVNRSWHRTFVEGLRTPNSALSWILSGAALFLAAVLYIPAVRGFFRFSFLHLTDLLICLGAGLFGIIWFEILKNAREMRRRRSLAANAPGS